MALFKTSREYGVYPGAEKQTALPALAELESILPLDPLDGAIGVIRDYVSRRWREFKQGTGISKPPKRKEGVPETPAPTRLGYSSGSLKGYPLLDRVYGLAYRMLHRDLTAKGYTINEVPEKDLRRMASYSGPDTVEGFQRGYNLWINNILKHYGKLRALAHEGIGGILETKTGKPHGGKELHGEIYRLEAPFADDYAEAALRVLAGA